jgi:hypothetical protein
LAWLGRLDAAVGGRWQPLPTDPPAAAALADTPALRVRRDDRPHSVLRLDETGVRLDMFDPATGLVTTSQRAELGARTRAALQAELAQLPR